MFSDVRTPRHLLPLCLLVALIALWSAPTANAASLDTTITAGPTGLTNNSSPAFSFDANGWPASIECSLDGGSYSYCTSPKTVGPLADGDHSFRARYRFLFFFVDRSPATRSFTVDTTAPTVSIGKPYGGTTIGDAVTAEFSVSEPATTTCQLDGNAAAPCTSPTTYGDLSPGAHTFTVTATDAAGNTSSLARSFTIAPPLAVTIVDPGHGSTVTSTTTPVTWQITGGVPPITSECSLNDSEPVLCTSPWVTPHLGFGQYKLTVTASDARGAIVSEDMWFASTYYPPPAITSPAEGQVLTTSTVSVSFVGVNSATFECSLDGGPAESCSSPKVYSNLSNGTHTFVVTSNLFGVLNSTSRTFHVNAVSGTQDTFITNGPASPTSDNTPTFSFGANPSILQPWPCPPGTTCIQIVYDATPYYCRVDGGAWTFCGTLPSAPKPNANYTTGPLADGTHTFEVYANGPGGIDPTPASRTFVVST